MGTGLLGLVGKMEWRGVGRLGKGRGGAIPRRRSPSCGLDAIIDTMDMGLGGLRELVMDR